METLSLEQVKAYQGEYKVVPICRSMYADVRTPIEVLRIVKNISSHCYLLESMEDSQRWGRYTFIGYDPQMGLYCKDGTVHIKTGAEVQTHLRIITDKGSPDPYGPSGTAYFPDTGRQ